MTESVPIDIAIPGDKSLSHRALMFAAMAKGRSQLRGVLDSADVQSTAECLRRLGAPIPPIESAMTIEGGGVASFTDPSRDLDCGNSGTSARLLAGIVAGAGRSARFTGDASLSKRPMKRIAGPLTQMGATFAFESGDGLPMRVTGAKLRGIEFTSQTASAQLKSALLLAGFASGAEVVVHEPARSRDHTERMLAAFGVPIVVDRNAVTLSRHARGIEGFEFDVPGDPSSAAFFAAWALLTGRAVRTSPISLNPTRTGFLDALKRVGGHIMHEPGRTACGEPVGNVSVRGELTTPFTIPDYDVPSMIDELPLVACMAAYAPGETRITGAGELRVKESDRIKAVVSNLRVIGADADELPDGFVVRGGRKPLRGRVTTHADHRIAMAFGILGAINGNEITLDDRECVAVSFPAFWSTLDALQSA